MLAQEFAADKVDPVQYLCGFGLELAGLFFAANQFQWF